MTRHPQDRQHSSNLRYTKGLIALLAAISILVFLATSYLLYRTSLAQASSKVEVMAAYRAHAIRAVLEFDSVESLDFPGGSLEATLSQVRNSHMQMSGFGESGEFVLARRSGDVVEFLLEQRFQTGDKPEPVPWNSVLAEPMRLALRGQYGSIIGLDYRGRRVLAGYAPIEGHALGVVVKMDLREVRAPFLRSGLIVAVLSAVLVMVGAAAFNRITAPLLWDLVRNRKRLEEAQRISNTGSFEWNIQSGELFWSQQVFRIFGTQPLSYAPTYEKFLEAIHDEDRELVEAAVKDSLDDPEKAYQIEHRVKRPDGSLRYVAEIGRVDRDGKGRPVRMVGTVQDVTEAKSAEQSLSLLEQAVHSIKDAVLIVDKRGTVIDCNRAYEMITGFTAAEVRGRRTRFGRCSLNSSKVTREISAALRGQGEWNGEVWDRRKSGEYYPVELSITTIFDQYERASHAVTVFRDSSERHLKQTQLENLAFFDQLTGLPNRGKLTQLLSQRISACHQGPCCIGVCLFDLDQFKLLNSTLGHTLGDQVLKEFASRLSKYQRSSDELGRYGGDEFGLIINGCDGITQIGQVVRHLIVELNRPMQVADSQIDVGVSIGVSQYPADGSEPSILFSKAELALQDLRSAERTGFRFFDVSMEDRARKRRKLESQLHQALRENEFLLRYQPKVDLDSMLMVSAEALIRWERPDGQTVSPADFIPVAEGSGLILPLGEWVLDKAIGFAARLNVQGSEPLQIAINLSARQFIQKDLAQMIIAKIEEHAVAPELIEFEVTESAAMVGVEQVVETLQTLRDFGCSIAIDDFGTGYSSLAYLKQLPLNTLKIDRAFVVGVTRSEKDADMARGIISIGKNLGLRLVAEGVETPEQFAFFSELGCDLVQGYIVSQPLSEEAFLDRCANRHYRIDRL